MGKYSNLRGNSSKNIDHVSKKIKCGCDKTKCNYSGTCLHNKCVSENVIFKKLCQNGL